MRGGGDGSATTETVSATLRVTACFASPASDHDLVVPGAREHCPRARGQAGVLQVVQQVLGLVLEAEHAHARALLDVGERHALLALALEDRVAVRAGLRVADRAQHALLDHRRHPVLEPLGLLVDLIPGNVEHVGEEALDQPVAADDAGRVLLARVGELERLVGRAGHVAVGLEPADHLVDRRRRHLHRSGDVGSGDRQAGLLEPVDDLEVLLLGDGGLFLGHARDPSRGGSRH